MQQTPVDSPSYDFSNSFAFDSEIPSRYLGPVSPSSPSLWSLSITPSIFGRGSTPGHAESNPFEMSFGTPGGNDGHLFRDNSGDVDPGRTPGAFDSFSFDLGRGAGGRKRALSTPMIETPGGTRWGLGGEVSKRARRDESETSFGGTTAPSDLSRSLDDFSPLSSSVLTPTDSSSIPLPSFDGSFDKLSNDPYGSSYQFGLASPPAFQEHFSIPSPLPTTTISAPTHSTYQQFAFPAGTVHPSVNSVAPYLFLDQSGVAPSSEAPAAPEPTTGKGGKKGKKVAKLGKKRKKDEAQVSEGGEADDEARRKVFLERNRVAACKSRQKKKEKVGNLESLAAECAAKNAHLQTVARGLQQELMELRALLSTHDGCACEHVLGYLAREAEGGGIPTINALAGRTLELDYTAVPTMGSEDDTYASHPHFRVEREGSMDSSTVVAMEPPIPILPVVGLGLDALPPSSLPSVSFDTVPIPSFSTAILSRPPLSLDLRRHTSALDIPVVSPVPARADLPFFLGGSMTSLPLRATSEPPVATPKWESGSTMESYFALPVKVEPVA